MSKVEGSDPIDPPPPLMPSCDFFYLMPSRVKLKLKFISYNYCLYVNVYLDYNDNNNNIYQKEEENKEEEEEEEKKEE